MNFHWVSIAAVVLAMTSGCQCCPLFNSYANVIDDASDRHIYFDRLYNPKFDLTRMGKPDWYSRFSNFFCPNCTQNGCYDGYDDCNLYPPLYPYSFPSNVMPPPTIRTERIPRQIDLDMQPAPETSETVPVPEAAEPPTPAPPPATN